MGLSDNVQYLECDHDAEEKESEVDSEVLQQVYIELRKEKKRWKEGRRGVRK